MIITARARPMGSPFTAGAHRRRHSPGKGDHRVATFRGQCRIATRCGATAPPWKTLGVAAPHEVAQTGPFGRHQMMDDGAGHMEEFDAGDVLAGTDGELGLLAPQRRGAHASHGRVEPTQRVEQRPAQRHGCADGVANGGDGEGEAAVAAADDPVELRREPPGRTPVGPARLGHAADAGHAVGPDTARASSPASRGRPRRRRPGRRPPRPWPSARRCSGRRRARARRHWERLRRRRGVRPGPAPGGRRCGRRPRRTDPADSRWASNEETAVTRLSHRCSVYVHTTTVTVGVRARRARGRGGPGVGRPSTGARQPETDREDPGATRTTSNAPLATAGGMTRVCAVVVADRGWAITGDRRRRPRGGCPPRPGPAAP